MKNLLSILSLLLIFTLGAGSAFSQQAPRMTKEALRAMLGNPDVYVIDVRTPQEWETSEKKIEGALREDPLELRGWMSKFPKDKTLVFYCS